MRKDGGIRTVADLKGKRVPYGFSAMRALEPTVRAILATAGLSEKDIRPVLVPNVIRSADDFLSGAADAFYFAFGAPKVREVDVTVGGIRMAEIDEKGMPEARKIERWGYLTEVTPGPVFVGVEKPMKIYSFDNLIFTSAKSSDDFVYKVIDTMMKNKPDLIAVQPVLREFSAPFAYKQYERGLPSRRTEVFQGAQHHSAAAGLSESERSHRRHPTAREDLTMQLPIGLRRPAGRGGGRRDHAGGRAQRLRPDLRLRLDAARVRSTTPPARRSPRCSRRRAGSTRWCRRPPANP